MMTRRVLLTLGSLTGLTTLLQIPWTRTRKQLPARSMGLSSMGLDWPTWPQLPDWCFKHRYVLLRDVMDREHVRTFQLRKVITPFGDRHLELEISVLYRLPPNLNKDQLFLRDRFMTQHYDLTSLRDCQFASGELSVHINKTQFAIDNERLLPEVLVSMTTAVDQLRELRAFVLDYSDLHKIGPEGLKKVPVGPFA